MRPGGPIACAAALLLAAAALSGCELALHEVQQAGGDGCDPWQAGCPAVLAYDDGEPAHLARMNAGRSEIVEIAADARQRRCDGVGLACQGRIIGDVLWDQYLMVLAGRSDATATAANAKSAVPAGEAAPAAGSAPLPAETKAAPGRVVRTHGSRAGEAATAAPR